MVEENDFCVECEKTRAKAEEMERVLYEYLQYFQNVRHFSMEKMPLVKAFINRMKPRKEMN